MGEGRVQFQQEIQRLEEQALGGLDMVVGLLDEALEALDQCDAELAAIVVADDDRIDGRYLEVHQGVLSLLARQAPVAGDLRLVAALLHLVKHLERIGDQCTNIAKMVPLLGHEPPTDDQIVERIRAMGAQARSQVRQARQSFALRDPELALDLSRQDDTIDCMNREIFRRAIEVGGVDADLREWAMSMVLVSRALERIGDNAVDIGEQTVFVVTGLFRELGEERAAR
ncbi:MAG TPA: phosphate signaling complex protein PhoU [Solirubrobacteraceae bacterium]|nr:phosphate signaling complex protein PhoU [Solirubrobacteraceae bacterium]